jgi:hypothetical protein
LNLNLTSIADTGGPPYRSTFGANGWRRPNVALRHAGVCDGPMKIVTCACGQQWRGSDAELVAAVSQHGLEVHNMPVSSEQVLAMAVEEDAIAAGGE